MLGIIKENTSLDIKYNHKSLLERILLKKIEDAITTPLYFILVIDASPPYMKFGDITMDENKLKYNQSDVQYWINLYEPGKLIAALESIKLIYYDNDGVCIN